MRFSSSSKKKGFCGVNGGLRAKKPCDMPAEYCNIDTQTDGACLWRSSIWSTCSGVNNGWMDGVTSTKARSLDGLSPPPFPHVETLLTSVSTEGPFWHWSTNPTWGVWPRKSCWLRNSRCICLANLFYSPTIKFWGVTYPTCARNN